MQAATIEAADWWARTRGAGSANWITNYQNSLKTRHRNVIVEIVKELQPETLVEVGCHCGPNLVRLAQELPHLRMIGIDANVEAIQAGRGWVNQLGLGSRIQLNAGRFPDATQETPSGCCDVVLSCYACAYIAPGDLDATLYELGRLATKAILLAEPMSETQTTWHGAMSGYSEWAHNYQHAAKWLNTWRGMTTRLVAIEPPVDRLNAVLVATRSASDETLTLSVP